MFKILPNCSYCQDCCFYYFLQGLFNNSTNTFENTIKRVQFSDTNKTSLYDWCHIEAY